MICSDIETMARPKLRVIQLDRLRWSVAWAYERVPFLRVVDRQ